MTCAKGARVRPILQARWKGSIEKREGQLLPLCLIAGHFQCDTFAGTKSFSQRAGNAGESRKAKSFSEPKSVGGTEMRRPFARRGPMSTAHVRITCL